MTKSTAKRVRRKTADRPTKPYKDFPLYAHPSGNWAKKIRGHFYYFGRWGQVRQGKMERLPFEASWEAALKLFNAQRDDLYAGRRPKQTKEDDDLTVALLCNRFLTAKLKKLDSKADPISPRTFVEYRQITDMVIAEFKPQRLIADLEPLDFENLAAEIGKRVGAVRKGNEISSVRTLFKWGSKNIKGFPTVIFGSEFERPKVEKTRGVKLFTKAEVHRLLDNTSVAMRAMILLGVNCGYGNTDVSSLKLGHLDLDAGWATFPRPKTKVSRKCPLWPETVAALRLAVESRPKPKSKDDAACVFLTSTGNRLVRQTTVGKEQDLKLSRTDAVTAEFAKLLRKLKINGRNGLGFYSLRHTFTTIALGTGDRSAVKAIMGHKEYDTLSIYDEAGPSDARLLTVTSHVHDWLFAEGGAK